MGNHEHLTCIAEGVEAVGKLAVGPIATIVYDLAMGWCIRISTPGRSTGTLYEIKSRHCPLCGKLLPE